MITIDVDHYDEETEIAITAAKAKISKDKAGRIVKIVRALRESGKCEFAPTVRGCIMIAKSLEVLNGTSKADNQIFKEVCQDILASETSRVGSKTNQDKVRKYVSELISKHC
jgi:hypothetical protein